MEAGGIFGDGRGEFPVEVFAGFARVFRGESKGLVNGAGNCVGGVNPGAAGRDGADGKLYCDPFCMINIGLAA